MNMEPTETLSEVSLGEKIFVYYLIGVILCCIIWTISDMIKGKIIEFKRRRTDGTGNTRNKNRVL